MFINLKTDRPAWLVSHDSDVIYSLAGDLAHPHHRLPSYEFFAGHREATPDEIKEHTPRAAAPAPKPAAPKPQAPKIKAPAPKAKVGKGSARKVSKGRSSPSRAKPPAAASAAPPSPPTNHGGGGGEPRGE